MTAIAILGAMDEEVANIATALSNVTCWLRLPFANITMLPP